MTTVYSYPLVTKVTNIVRRLQTS